MTHRFVPVPRLVALSVAFTMLAAPAASAQTRTASPPVTPPAGSALLSAAAFARLTHQPPGSVSDQVVKDPPRLNVLKSVATVVARGSQTTPAPKPQGSWASRHQWAVVGIILGAVVGGIILGAGAATNWGDD